MVASPFPSNSSQLVGRDRERRQLRELLRAACESQGSLVLVSGEAGIGKTTLVDDLVHEARQRGCVVLAGGCYDLTTTPPYGPWSEALRDYRPDGDLPAIPPWFGNADELEKFGSQPALFDEAYRFFTAVAGVRPLAIVLEDLHWADSATLEALRYLARQLKDVAILLVATYRDDEITQRHDLYQLLPMLVRESRAQRIYLNPLARHDVWEMISRGYDLAETDIERLVTHLGERSQGNPFFAHEILHGLEDERILRSADDGWELGNLEHTQVPVLLRQALDMRLARLSPDTRSALRVAAVIGQHIPVDLWRDVVEVEAQSFEQAVTEALEARVLEEDAVGSPLEFRHALLREALYESLSPPRRRSLHHRLGEALAASPHANPEAVAHHFQISDDPRAAHWWVQAGVQAEGSYARRVAAGHYIAALAMLESDPDAAHALGWLLLHLGHLLRGNDPECGMGYVEEATRVARIVDDPVLAAYSEHVHGLLRCYRDEIGIGLKEMENANASWEMVTASHEQQARQVIASLFPAKLFSNSPVAPGSLLFFKLGRLPGINTLTPIYVLFLATTGRFRETMRVGVPFVDHVAAATDDTLLVQEICQDAYLGLAVAADWLGYPEKARGWRAAALEAYQALRDLVQVRHVRSHELTYLLVYQTDQVANRRRIVTALLATANQGGGTLQGHPIESLKLIVDLVDGCWKAAQEIIDGSYDAHDPFARTMRLRAFRLLGREQDDEHFATAVRADIRAALINGPATEPGWADHEYGVIAQQLAGDLALDAGNLAEARDWITAHGQWREWSESVLGRAETELLWARYHRIAGDLERARQHAEQARSHASDPRQPLALIAAHRALGQLNIETGRYEQAAEYLQTSLDLADQCEAPYERALTILELAELAAQTGNTAETRRLLRAVRGICQPLQARRSLERADDIESRIISLDYPAGLSAREVEVLELVAEGLTNTDIGAALFISPRTVAQHLRSVYSKLGVKSRTAAVARWTDLNSG